ncbi:MAG: hypothetical protein KF901_16465 [Myxococcales bacterium]|nr:hypothetical protein [Myxococcales bacterium]
MMQPRFINSAGILRVSAACLTLLVACAGETDAVNAASSYVAHAEPLPTIPVSAWQGATAGCEGRLGQIEAWGIAAGAPELVVALGEADCVICVDSYSAVESELVVAGSLDLDVLWHSYVAALQELEPYSAEVDFDGTAVAGDPHPTPSRPFADADFAPRWDLSQRLTNPVGGTPHPQPSAEGNASNEGSSSTGTSSGAGTGGGTDMPPPPTMEPAPRP